jgi:hypothetical protein
VGDEFPADPTQFQERHYAEFVTFLPYVQRFLYGEGRQKQVVPMEQQARAAAESPMRVFRREDIAAVRVVTRSGEAPITLRVKHIDLYFFYDIDVVILNVEVSADELTFDQAQEVLYRFGRAYPAGWEPNGQSRNTLYSLEWLDQDSRVLARSDANERERFLEYVCEHRSPRISNHWAFVLKPLLLEHAAGGTGLIRYRLLEYHRMPTMGYVAVDEPTLLSRSDFIRLGLVTGAGGDLPFSEKHLIDFEERYCYDRFWCNVGPAPQTRYLCCGHALIVVGDADFPYFRDGETGVLGQFRHPHFLLFLIAHFQKATLLMFADRLVEALKNLDITDPNKIRLFKRAIRQNYEIFLRFTHRYWFHEVSEQAQTRALFRMCVTHLNTDPLYDDVKQRIGDMNTYLDADSLRRQANTVVKLTVVTTFGLIGTVATGFLGMNLIAEAESPLLLKLGYFMVVLIAATALTVYTIVKAKRFSDFLDALSDENLGARQKLSALLDAWRREPVGNGSRRPGK